MSKTFDEGGAKGLLLANLGVSDSSCHIVFDSSSQDTMNDVDDTTSALKSCSNLVENQDENQLQYRIPEGMVDVTSLALKLESLLSERCPEDDWNLDNHANVFDSIRSVPLVPQLSALRAEHEQLVASGCCGPDAAIALAVTIGPKTPAGKVRHYHPNSQQEQDADYSIHQEAFERSQRKVDMSVDGKNYTSRTALFQNPWNEVDGCDDNATPANNFTTDDDYGIAYHHDDGIDDDDDDHCFDAFIAKARYSDISSTSIPFQPVVESNSSDTLHQQSSAAVSNFIDAIASGMTALSNSDYEYFSSNKMKGGNSNDWAGAAHWKRSIAAKSTANNNSTTLTKTTKKKSVKRSKLSTKQESLVVLDPKFSPDLSFLWNNTTKRKGGTTSSTTLSKAMITKYTNDENMLPIDVGFQNEGNCSSLQQLTKLFLRPNVTVLQPLSHNHANMNSFPKNDSSTETKKTVDFLIPSNDWNDDEGDNDGPGFDFGAFEGDEHTNDDDGEFIVPVLDNVRKVDKVRVGYATVAKKVDVKRLKRDLWNEIESRFTHSSNNNDEKKQDEDIALDMCQTDILKADDQTVALSTHAADETAISFQAAVRTLGLQQSQIDITLPFYFICILHLANEKGLRLEQGDGTISNVQDEALSQRGNVEKQQLFLSDFSIHQD
jgi:condensin complex subunit 2